MCPPPRARIPTKYDQLSSLTSCYCTHYASNALQYAIPRRKMSTFLDPTCLIHQAFRWSFHPCECTPQWQSCLRLCQHYYLVSVYNPQSHERRQFCHRVALSWNCSWVTVTQNQLRKPSKYTLRLFLRKHFVNYVVYHMLLTLLSSSSSILVVVMTRFIKLYNIILRLVSLCLCVQWFILISCWMNWLLMWISDKTTQMIRLH